MTKNFQNYLRCEVTKRAKANRTESIALLIWYLENIFCLDQDNAVSIICDGKNDKGIDGIMVDDVEEIVYIFQSKFKEKNDGQIGDVVLRDFCGVKEWFKTASTVDLLKSSTINKELKSLLDTLQLEEKIGEYDFEYHFVSNAFKNHDTNEYEAVNDDVMIWDLNELKKGYYEVKDDPLVEDVCVFSNLNHDNIIEHSLSNGINTIIIPIRAKELMSLKGISNMTLFNKNVRYGLGKTRVNKAIAKTLESETERNNFLLFHNGISMVCEEFNYDNVKNELSVHNYSIVNGAQSILSFYNNSEYLDDNVIVLMKVSEVGTNIELTTLISKYNNNQNSISMRDLRSNDKIQNRLVKDFERVNEKFNIEYSYIPKRGKSVEYDNEIQSDLAGQLIESCYLLKPYNTHLKAAMFDTRYKDIFSKNINACKIIIYYDASKKYEKLKDSIEDDYVASYGLVKYFVISTMFKMIKNEKDIYSKLFDENHYFNNQLNWGAFFEKIISLLFKSLNKHIRRLNSDEYFIYKNFFKNAKSVEKLTDDLLSDLYGILELDNLSIKEIAIRNGVNF